MRVASAVTRFLLEAIVGRANGYAKPVTPGSTADEEKPFDWGERS